jgi:TRAP-type mannitol/chloroaromatic compound transport system substrate-binding protein
MGNTGAQMGGWYRKPIKTLADIKGLKMRIGGFGGKVLSAIGGVPQNIPAAKSTRRWKKAPSMPPSGLAPMTTRSLASYKVAKHYYYPAWWEGGPQLTLYVNQKAYDALPKDYQAIVAAAASHAHIDMQAKYDAKNPAALKRLVANGTKLFPMPPAIMKEAYDAAMQLYSDLSAKNPGWKKIYDDYAAFRDEQNLWFRFTEASFDNFMQSGRFAKAKAPAAKKK